MGNSTTKVDGRVRFSVAFQHEVCQYYDNNTIKDTAAKYNLGQTAILRWRKVLGYRNKSLGYNLATAQVTPLALRKNYRIVKSENGDLKAEMMSLQGQIEDLKESNRQHQESVEAALSILIGSNRLQ